MRVAVLDDRYHMAYGAQLQALAVTSQFKANGHSAIFVTTSEGILADRARSQDLDVLIVPAPEPWLRFERKSLGEGVLARSRSALTMLGYSRTVANALRDFDADLVVASNVRTSLILFWHRLRRQAPVMLYAQNNTPYGPFAALSAIIAQRFGMIGPSCIETFPRWVRKRVLKRSFPLPGGRDLDRFVATPETPWSAARSPNVLSIASLNVRKGHHDLIDAIAQVRAAGVPATLTVVGDADGEVAKAYAAGLIAQADRLGVPVEFAGWQGDVRPFLAHTNLFVLASSNEGLPGVLIEAMASGRACVATRAGNAGTLVDGSGGGISVDIGDVAGLATAIAELLNDHDRRRACAASGHSYVNAELGLDRMYRDLRSGLDDLVPFSS